ncbi:MAG TPA: DUF4250 domain-containing protein [Lachnospiraceae bacterium]|nr:DUF4250 domain-containing protein [Lachnospiraceae bacterium]
MLPNDPAILLSFINTKLRDFYVNIDHLCEELQENRKEIEDKLMLINYYYDEEKNQFV